MRVYQTDANSESGWMQLGDDINGEAAYDNSGYSVSLLLDGNMVAIGSPYIDDYSAKPMHYLCSRCKGCLIFMGV
jgi:hypothetical protein